MDGTLLDLHFDNLVWNDRLPRFHAAITRLDLLSAHRLIRETLERTRGALRYYCLDHWSHEFGIDIHEIERELARFVRVRPGVRGLLDRARARGLRLVLATNAHPQSLARKLKLTGIGRAFDVVVSAHDLGHPKEDDGFWSNLGEQLHIIPQRTMFIDDNPSVLLAAQRYGVRALYGIARPDSRGPRVRLGEFHCLESFDELCA